MGRGVAGAPAPAWARNGGAGRGPSGAEQPPPVRGPVESPAGRARGRLAIDQAELSLATQLFPLVVCRKPSSGLPANLLVSSSMPPANCRPAPLSPCRVVAAPPGALAAPSKCCKANPPSAPFPAPAERLKRLSPAPPPRRESAPACAPASAPRVGPTIPLDEPRNEKPPPNVPVSDPNSGAPPPAEVRKDSSDAMPGLSVELVGMASWPTRKPCVPLWPLCACPFWPCPFCSPRCLPLSSPPEPVGPVGPVAPVGPGEPVAPVAPVAPGDPVAPVAPVAPGDPVAPVAPVAPGDPVAPVAPVAPGDPVAPVAPVAPGDPVAPVAPVAPGDPVAPVAPVAPGDPVAPVAPVAP